jgi:hypothetical protein
MGNMEQYKKRFYNLMESTMGDVKPLITEENQESSISLSNINELYNKIVYEGTEYRGSIGTSLKGVIVMTYEFSEMNKRNNWNRPERINVDFSSAKPLEISEELTNITKSKSLTLNHNIKSDYGKINFIYLSNTASLFGETAKEGKIKSGSVLVKCKQGQEILFIYQDLNDGLWYYINTVG